MNNNLPTPDELQKSCEDLCNIHVQHLEEHEVKIPNVRRYNERAKSIWLAVLHYYKGKNVHKSFITEICQRDNPTLGPDQQVRHLKRDGWHLTNDGRGHHLLDPYQPSPEWETDKKRRHGRLKAKDFAGIKKPMNTAAPLVAQKKVNRAIDMVKTKSNCNRDIKILQNLPQI